jgi:aspartate/methionine/tyrosine aminotransferase
LRLSLTHAASFLSPLQLGVAAAFNAEDGQFEGVPELFEANFQRLSAALESAGIEVCPAQGGYFLLADVAATGMTDFEFVTWLAETAKVIAVPLQVFYSEPSAQNCTLVRFSICKTREIIDQACAALEHPEAVEAIKQLIADAAEKGAGGGARL